VMKVRRGIGIRRPHPLSDDGMDVGPFLHNCGPVPKEAGEPDLSVPISVDE
jgi:hypothetical protein